MRCSRGLWNLVGLACVNFAIRGEKHYVLAVCDLLHFLYAIVIPQARTPHTLAPSTLYIINRFPKLKLTKIKADIEALVHLSGVFMKGL